jgi:hypothetical protein
MNIRRATKPKIPQTKRITEPLCSSRDQLVLKSQLKIDGAHDPLPTLKFLSARNHAPLQCVMPPLLIKSNDYFSRKIFCRD